MENAVQMTDIRIPGPRDANSQYLVRMAQLAQEVMEEMPFGILHMEWAGGRGNRVLRIYIERIGEQELAEDSKVNIDDCAKVNRALNLALEANNPIPFAYTLEVSSPGVNRPLVAWEDFEHCIKKVVAIECLEVVDGRRRFHGRLMNVQNEGSRYVLVIEIDGKNYEVPFSQIKKATLDYFASQKTESEI